MKPCIVCNKEIDGKHYSYCKACSNKRNAEYQQNNPEKIKERKKEHYQNNKEKILEQHKEYRQNNKEKLNKQKKEHYQNNKEKINKRHKEYRQNNKEKIKEQKKEYLQNNKEYFKEYKKEYHKNNPHKVREASRKRRALEKANIHEPYSEDQVLKLYGSVCHICKEEIDLSANRSTGASGWEQGLHLDHVIPISKGGADTLENVKPAHGLCNLQKSASIL